MSLLELCNSIFVPLRCVGVLSLCRSGALLGALESRGVLSRSLSEGIIVLLLEGSRGVLVAFACI